MNAASIAVESAGATLLKALINQVQQLPKPWQQMLEREQEVVIFRLREAVQISVRDIVKRIAAGNFPHTPATVESVTFKDGVKVVLQLSKSEEGTHALADATGGQAMVVLADPAAFMDGIERVQADADQASLDLPEPEPQVPSDEWQALVDSLEQSPPNEQGGEAAAPKSMGQQVHEFLAAVDVHVAIEACEAWTERECTVAAYWAIECAKDPENCKIARPHWLPLPSAIALGHTRVYHSATALSAYVDVPPEIIAKVQEEWGDKEGAPGYDDYVRALSESQSKGQDDQQAA